jgi:hypothetical protein
MSDYIKAKEITWTIGFSDEEVFNPDYGITGIPHMAIIAPDGTLRHTGLHPAMPHAEKVEKIDGEGDRFGGGAGRRFSWDRRGRLDFEPVVARDQTYVQRDLGEAEVVIGSGVQAAEVAGAGEMQGLGRHFRKN